APSRDDDQSFVCDNPNVATAATIEPPQFDEPPDDVLAARAADECAAANKSVVLSEPHSKPARPQVTSPKRQLPSSDTAPSEIPKHGNRRPGNASSPARIESAPSARCAPLNGIRRHEDHAVEILVPGTHCDRGSPTQIRMSEDGFAQAVLQAIPDEELYLSEGRVGQIVGDRGARRFESLSGREGESAMRLLISRHCRLVQRSFDIRENVAETRVLTIRPDHAALVLAAAVRSPKLRQLRWFLRHPAFLGDALDLAKPGWNASHGAYYDEPAELEGLEPKTLTNESAQKAFHDLTVDFPFANEASRQNFIGMLLTAILRPALPGNAPMHAVIASLERTGKTKLIEQVLGGIVLGRPMPAIPIGWSPEEIEKRVASIALAGEGLVHLDNVRELDSPALASLLTASSIGVRQFGKLDLSLVANRLVLVASGNNIQAHSELSKRIVPITLQPLDATPELREDFVHPDLEEYVGRVRAQYLAILVGMVRSWKDSGSKPGSRRLGGFERWARVVGGILEEHGFREWMANYQDWVDNADPFSAELKAFVGIWHERFETSTVSTTALLEEIVLPRQLFVAKCLRTDNTRAQVSALGRYVLRPSTDRPVGSFVIRKHGSGNTNTWQLEPVSHTARGEAAA
ncbi:MAG: hypothetical protein JNJ88_16600, partial [Planctomycetes bacterium]|nr:hypothetical protein [Planctomycetota bacterium]